MKKIISLALSFVMLFSITAGLNISVYADELPASGSCGENVTYTFDSETGALTISGSGDMADYKQSKSPFYGQKGILSVTVNKGITSIGNNAFYATGVTNATIPDSVTKIGTNAFYYCKSLTGIIIPDNVTTIGNGAFEACTLLASAKIGKSVETIGNSAFFDCYALTSVTIPDSVTSIGNSAFNACTELTSLTIGKSVTTIGNSAFNYCKMLTGVALPDSVTSIGRAAFSGCETLESINIPKNVTSLGDQAFFCCSSLTGIEIPDSLTSISDRCFYACKALESITIPSSVTVIEDMAFYNCNALKDIYYSSTVDDWNKIDIVSGKYQGDLFVRNATIHCTDGLAHCRHVNTFEKKENIKGVTVNEKGSYDRVIYCSDCGVEMWRERVEVEVSAPALIIHWSSIDGVDLEEPVVIENVDPDSTVSEALEAAGYKSNSDIFTKDGYVELHLLYPKPMSEYKELGEVFDYAKLMTISSETRNTKIGENGLDIYTTEYVRLPEDTEVNIEVEAPVCGTSTTTQKYEEENDVWDLSTQTNYPIVTIPENVHYYLAVDVAPENHATELQNGAWVLNETTYNQPYIGTFEGGKPYYAFTGVFVEYGYLFPNSGPKLTINGIEPPAYSAGSRVGAWGIVPVTAVHTPVTDKAVAPTCAKKGKTAGSHCAACGEVIVAQEDIPATGKHEYSSKIVKTTAKTYTKKYTCKVCKKTYTKTFNKKANTLTAKGKTKKIKYKTIKNKNVVFARKDAITVKNAKGKVTYKKASGNKKITVSGAGKITVKKGLKKGIYKVKVKVKAAGTSTYKAETKTVTVSIIIK